MSEIIFFEGNSCTQDRVGSLDASQPWNLNLKKSTRIDNDEIRSARLLMVPRGTVIRVYDSPEGKKSDDWTEISVLRTVPQISINTFEASVSTSDMTQVFHKHNGLDGKISRITIQPGATNSPEYRVSLALYEEFARYPAKGGRAYELLSQDSNYRVWRPDVATSPDGGVALSMKLDHIRGMFQDDHALMQLAFRPNGTLASSSWTIELQGHNPVSKFLDVASGELPAGVSSVAKLVATLTSAIEDLGERGGRLNFPAVLGFIATRVTLRMSNVFA